MLQNPDIFILGLRIQEPITTLTDVFVTIVCFYAVAKTQKKLDAGSLRNYFSYYFLLMGLSTLFGGFCGHAFQYELGLTGKLPGWLISTAAILLFALATIKLTSPLLSKKVRNALSALIILESVVSFILIAKTHDLKYVQFHATFGLLLVSTSLHAIMAVKKLNEGSKYILAGVGVSAIMAIIFNLQIAISKWFNHMDIAHVLMGLTILLFLKGVLRFNQVEDGPVT